MSESGNDLPIAPPSAARAAPVGHVAVRGVIWSTVLTLGTKTISVAQQFLIAKYFLSEADFGLVAMCQVVILLASVGQNLGLSEIMARRHRSFDRWAQAAIWLSVTGALLCIAVILMIALFWNSIFTTVSAFVSGKVLEVPQIQGLLVIWSIGLPFDAAAAIFTARLRAELRFRTWAVIGSIQSLSVVLMSIALAMLGMGAYALVIPMPIMMVGCALMTWYASRQRVGLRPQFNRWLPLLRDARFFFTGNIFNVLLQQGDYLITGFFFEKAILGAYYFAFRMSSQTGQLISSSLGTILVPSFARLDRERDRQIAAYERICSSLLLIGIPLCCLQALVAQPVFELLFSQKWRTAAPLFEYLSLAMGFAVPMTTAMSLLIAQGRLRANMVLTIFQAILFLTMVLYGALCGSVAWVARLVSLFYLVFGTITVLVPVTGAGISIIQFLKRTYLFPVLTGAATYGAGLTLSHFLPATHPLVLILVRMTVWLAIVSLFLRIFRPAAAMEILPRLTEILGSLRARLRI